METGSKTTLNDIPDEVLLSLLSYVPLNQLLNKVSLVNRKFQNLCDDASLRQNLTFYFHRPQLNPTKIASILKDSSQLRSIIIKNATPSDCDVVYLCLQLYCRHLEAIIIECNHEDYLGLFGGLPDHCPMAVRVAYEITLRANAKNLLMILSRWKLLKSALIIVEYFSDETIDVPFDLCRLTDLRLFVFGFDVDPMKRFLTWAKTSVHNMTFSVLGSSTSTVLLEALINAPYLRRLQLFSIQMDSGIDLSPLKSLKCLTDLSLKVFYTSNVFEMRRGLLSLFQKEESNAMLSLTRLTLRFYRNSEVITEEVFNAIFGACDNLEELRITVGSLKLDRLNEIARSPFCLSLKVLHFYSSNRMQEERIQEAIEEIYKQFVKDGPKENWMSVSLELKEINDGSGLNTDFIINV